MIKEKTNFRKLFRMAGLTLVTTEAALFCYLYPFPSFQTPKEEAPSYASSSPSPDVGYSDFPTSPSASHPTRPRPITLNALLLSLRPTTDAQTPRFNGYKGAESFPLDSDVSWEEQMDLFTDDCPGRCLYLRDEEGMVTKVKLEGAPEEELEWYDEEMGCSRLKGNYWLYIDNEGKVKAWGVGRESKKTAGEVYSPCRK